MLQHLLLSCVLLLCPLLAHCVSFAQSPPRIPDTLAVQAYREGKELYTQGKYLRALEKYAQALADESTLTQATAADYWHHRAHALASSGAYREAVQAFEASLTRYAASGRVDESLMNTRICMVSLYLNFGEIEKARVLIDENDRFFKEDYQIRNLFQLVNLYRITDNDADAFELLNYLWIMLKNRKEDGLVMQYYNQCALLYGKNKDFARALAYSEKTLKFYENNEIHAAIIYQTMASCVRNLYYIERSIDERKKLFMKSMKYYVKAKEIYEKNQIINEHYAYVLNDIGLLARSEGDYERSLSLFNYALSITDRIFGKFTKNSVIQMANTINSLRCVKKYDEAFAVMEEALYRVGHVQNDNAKATLYREVYSLYWSTKNFFAASTFAKLAVNTVHAMRASKVALSQSLQDNYKYYWKHAYEHLASLLLEQGRIQEARLALLMLKEQEYQDVLRSADEKPSSMPLQAEEENLRRALQPLPQLLAQVREFEAIRQKRREGVSLSEAEEARFSTLVVNLDVERERFSSQIAMLANAGGKVAWDASVQLAKMDQAVGALPHTAALAFFMIEEKLTILLSHGGAARVLTVPVSMRDLSTLVTDFTIAVRTRDSDPRKLGKKLYDILLAPVDAILRQAGVNQILCTLYGDLDALPLAALYDGQHWMVEKYIFSHLSPLVEVNLGRVPVSGEPLVAAFGVTKGHGLLSPLPAVRRELAGLVGDGAGERGIFKGKIFLDGDFTTKNLSLALHRGYNMVHIATHFAQKEIGGVIPYMLLGDGSYLTINQLRSSAYDMSGLSLLTLSACATTRGQMRDYTKQMESMGVVAQLKGARACVATLWPVEDQSTADFMLLFYRALRHTQNKAAALQKAQQAMIAGEGHPESAQGTTEETRQAWRHPYYWGPFVLMGSWQ